MHFLGVDTGGTFTDFFYIKHKQVNVHKVLSTPFAPEQAILQGMRDLSVDLDDLLVVHGSTVATNAVLEGKGARTVFITNRGLGDLLTIGRQARRELYNLQPKPVPPPVPEHLCLETGGRLGADGTVIEPLTEADLENLRKQIQELSPEAVVINLLFSYLDASHEQAIEAVIPEGIFISRSSDVLPEYKEYERGITTWLNARVGPLMRDYLLRLEQEIAPAALSVMQSYGGTICAEQAGKHAVNLLLSGPAGGLKGAAFAGQAAGCNKLLTFDMGGTSTDVALIDGEPGLTSEGRLAGYPVAVPMVDMHTIGAGGGSIAQVDAGGLLQVGPESAGADPGPACYGKGGTQATVTDANLVLGRLRADAFLGGTMRLDIDASCKAVSNLARLIDCEPEQAAEGIIRIANEHMVAALRVISVQRGIDPGAYTLMSFGGAGGLHVCALADALEMRQAMVPVHGGVLSALGMLAAARSRELSRTVNGLLASISADTLTEHAQALAGKGTEEMLAEGVKAADIISSYSLDLRYLGQSYTLNVPLREYSAKYLGQAEQTFHDLHLSRFGHALDEPVELVNIRVSLKGPAPEWSLDPVQDAGAPTPQALVSLYGVEGQVPVFDRTGLGESSKISGPALITEMVATIYIESGWNCQVDVWGNLLLNKG